MRWETTETRGSTSATVAPCLRHRRVPWQEGREPGASSGESDPTPALHPARRPSHTGEDIHTHTDAAHRCESSTVDRFVVSRRSPVLHRQAVLASSCSQLEAIAKSTSPQRSSIPEFRVFPSTFLRHGATPTPSATPILSPSPASEQSGGPGNGSPLPGQPLYLRHSAGMTEKDGGSVRILRLVRSHSEPGGLGVSADTGKSEAER